MHLEQILVNLVSNSQKYGAPPVTISTQRVGLRVELVVTDRGPGVEDAVIALPQKDGWIHLPHDGYRPTDHPTIRKALTVANVTKGLYVRLEAKPGKEQAVEDFLKGGLSLVNDEPETATWYALKLGPSSFGIFDSFADDAGRDAHLSGKVAEALGANADELFSQAPSIEQLDVLAAK